MDCHDLLAVIHRDGGHYEQEHGTEQAITDAIDIVLQERALLYSYSEGLAHAPQYFYDQLKSALPPE